MTDKSRLKRIDWALKHVKSQEEWDKMTEQEQREYREYMVSVHAARDAWDTAIDEAKAEGREATQFGRPSNFSCLFLCQFLTFS